MVGVYGVYFYGVYFYGVYFYGVYFNSFFCIFVYNLFNSLFLCYIISTSPDAVELVLDILGLIWFTLIGQEVSRDDKDNSSVRKGKEESSNGLHVPLPKNICSQLLLVCLSILLKNSR